MPKPPTHPALCPPPSPPHPSPPQVLHDKLSSRPALREIAHFHRSICSALDNFVKEAGLLQQGSDVTGAQVRGEGQCRVGFGPLGGLGARVSVGWGFGHLGSLGVLGFVSHHGGTWRWCRVGSRGDEGRPELLQGSGGVVVVHRSGRAAMEKKVGVGLRGRWG